MKHYYLGDREISEAEAKLIERKNREVLRCGTVEQLLKIRPITVKEDTQTTSCSMRSSVN